MDKILSTFGVLVLVLSLLNSFGDNITGDLVKGIQVGKTTPQCNDHIDNDKDGKCDYLQRNAYCKDGSVVGDPGCSSKNDNDESPLNCVIACKSNNECGTNGYAGGNYCGTDGNVYRGYISYICQNAGTCSSTCNEKIDGLLIETCSYGCTNGACNLIVCGDGVCDPNQESSATCPTDCPVTKPDLIVSQFNLDRTTFIENQQFSIDIYAKNIGNAVALGSVNIGLRLYKNGIFWDGVQSAQDLNPEEEKLYLSRATYTLSAGTYDLDAFIDWDSRHDELDETNNHFRKNIIVSSSPSQFCGDGICNLNETSASCSIDCGTVSNSTNLTSCGNGICESGETSASCSVDCGAVNISTSCGNGICESGETSTSCSTDCQPTQFCGDGICSSTESCSTCSTDCGVCTVTKPDLIVSQFNLDRTTFVANQPFNANIYAKNIGNAVAPGSVNIGLRLYKNGVFLDGVQSAQDLNPGQEQLYISRGYTLPAGTYELDAFIDWDSRHNELDETNNHFRKNIIVS